MSERTPYTPVAELLQEMHDRLAALTHERDEAVRELRAKAAFSKDDIKANYFADAEFRETVCEIVNQVPDGHWITLIVESPASLTPNDKPAKE